MPISVFHSLTMTTPDNPAYENRPSHWNSAHVATLSAVGSEIIGAFSNDAAYNVSFSTNGGGYVVASANVTAAPSPVNVTGANGSVNAQTIAFSNSNGMTLGVSTAANGATVTGSYTVPSTAGLISRINVSAGTTSGNVSAFTLADSNGLSFGLNAGTITASHNGLTSQSGQAFSADASSTFQTLTFQNSNGISFSNNAGALRVTHDLQYTSATSAITSNALHSSASRVINIVAATNSTGGGTASLSSNVSFSNANGLTFYTSAGNAVVGSYTVPTVTDYFSKTNTTFNGTNVSGSITHNTAGLRIDLSAAAGGAAFSGGISGGNTSGDTGTVSNQLVFAGGNNITVSGSTNAGGMTVTISGANAGGAQTGISGIQVSDTTYTSGTVSWRNANGISFGASGVNGVSASYTVPSTAGLISAVKISAGTTSNNLSALTFADSNGISFGLNASTITASYTVPTQTAQTIGVYGSSQTTGSASSGTHDARSLSFIGAGIISVGNHSTSVGGTTTGIIISATQSNQAFSAGGGSSAFQTLSFSNGGGVTFTNTNGQVGATVATTYRASNDAVGLNTAQTNVTWTVNSSGISLNAAGYAGTGTSATNASVTLNSNGLAISVAAGGGVNPVASASNGSFSFTTINFSNANNVTFGTSAGSIITASVAAPGAAAENNWVNLLGANTAGNTTASGSTIGYSGINLTLSGTNGSVVNISAPATSSLVGSSGISISSNGSTITVGQILGSYYENLPLWQGSTTMTMFQSTSHLLPFVVPEPLSIDVIRFPVTASVAPSSTAATTGNSQFSYGHTRSHNFVVYSQGVGASSLSLQSYTSTQHTDRQSINVSAAANSTQFSYTNRVTYQMSTGATDFTYDYSSSAASLNFHTSGMTAITGNKFHEFPFAMSLTPGLYWLAYGVSSSTASQFNAQGTRLFNIASNYGASQANVAFGLMGAATNSTVGLYPGLGSFTTAGGGTTASIPLTAFTTSSAHARMFFQLGRSA
jgi:hypothetical protein